MNDLDLGDYAEVSEEGERIVLYAEQSTHRRARIVLTRSQVYKLIDWLKAWEAEQLPRALTEEES